MPPRPPPPPSPRNQLRPPSRINTTGLRNLRAEQAERAQAAVELSRFGERHFVPDPDIIGDVAAEPSTGPVPAVPQPEVGVVASLLLGLVGGVVGDRLPRRRVMLASDLVRCATQATTAVLLATGAARLWQLLVLQVAHGAAAAFFDPAATGLVPQTVRPGRLQQANALMGLSRSATGILGQIGAGVLVATVGPALALAVDAASFAVSAWSLALLRLAGTVRVGQESSFLAQLAAGWAEFRSPSWLWASVLHLSLLNLADWIGVATTLWVGAAWVLVSTGLVLAVPGIRQLQRTGRSSRGGP